MNFSSDEEDLLLLAVAEDEEHNKRKKRKWIHDINLDREIFGEFHTLMPQLRADPKRFYIYFRMTSDCFDAILNFIRADIRKSDTNYREAISPEERFAITLRFLATGDTYYTIGHSYRVGFSTVGQIVREVCEAICQRLQNIAMPEPNEETWKKAAEGFETRWQFPNCIGSIDGKHVTIKCPQKSGSNYFCYLKKFSIVLMAIVGPDYKFLCVDIGGFGKNSDSGIFEASNMGMKCELGQMNFPQDKNLPGQTEPCPHVFIGDEAFALRPYLMRPFPYRQSRSNIRKEKYNTRLCRARRVVENAFGILAQKWRIFYRPLETSVGTTVTIVKTACLLHNYLILTNSDDQYFEFLEPPEDNIEAFTNLGNDPRRASTISFEIDLSSGHHQEPTLQHEQ
ncbi:uncharacterized protein LOC135138913 isoform X2 [Zophobas morio]|uniref:uncharacterized protein LOC135138913 isoform X2 n=1 Tax=Zophobas morio TaxID=2755281 RepID=UPI003082F55A